MEEIRLQKFLANAGIASRRKCEELISNGKVKVNGQVVKELGTKINPNLDEVIYNGKKVETNNEKIYILLNKPIGYVTTAKDQFNRNSVLDLVKIKERIVPVGRLDMYTSGALILTNDGDFVNKVIHPSKKIDKTYIVTIKGEITKEEINNLEEGVIIDEYKTKPAKVKIIKQDKEKNQTRIAITIHEGKNRQIRKMCKSIGKRVLALHRTQIGNINVKDLEIGKWRYLSIDEINSFNKN